MMQLYWSSFVAMLAAVLFVAAPYAAVAQSDDDRRLVLIASGDSGITALSAAEIRKLFLGVVVEQQGRSLVALRNQTDPVLHEVFLQKVMFMSGPMYERTLLTRLLRTKATRPEAYDSEPALLQALHTNPGAVTYMWADRAAELPDLRVVVELWRE
ncbi:MAG TPA: hypothetical protein VIR60_03560 [Gammaproteobacteria bacterium]